jgi:glycosyltransferase involved in cell wall biosynthesis
MRPISTYPLLSTFPDAADERTLNAFNNQYGDIRMAPILVIVPAYNEAEAIEAVLETIPACYQAKSGPEIEIDVLVVVDGATDSTLETAVNYASRNSRNSPRIFVCPTTEHRGQGAALRVGYAVARARGARYIVTYDADGQYDINELQLLLGPLLADNADFVTGSRALGRQVTDDLLRRFGTPVFAGIVSFFVQQKITDTSFGFRAMRAELTKTVDLRQPQYQSAELLIGLLCRGCRIVEQPMTMRKRKFGKSKKGNNILFGFRYMIVVIRTLIRERILIRLRQRFRNQPKGSDRAE